MDGVGWGGGVARSAELSFVHGPGLSVPGRGLWAGFARLEHTPGFGFEGPRPAGGQAMNLVCHRYFLRSPFTTPVLVPVQRNQLFLRVGD